MVAEALQQIRDAEAKAEDTARRARASGKKLIADAQETAEQLLDEMRKAAREEEKNLTAEAARAAQAEAEKLMADSRSRVESVGKAGEKRVEAGITKVLETVAAQA